MDKEEITTIRKILHEELTEMLARAPLQATIPLRAAAQACNVEYRWLLERIQRQEIPGYRPDPSASWRVYISDINAFLTRTSNFEAHPKKVVRRVYELR